MRRTLPIATATVSTVLLLLASVPTSAELGPDEVEMMGVWADTPTVAFLQPSLAVEDPTGKKVSLCDAPTACRGPVTGVVPFAEAVNPIGQEFKIAGDLVGTVWVSTNAPQMVVQGMQIHLVQTTGTTTSATILGSTTGTATTPMVEGDGSLVIISPAPTKFTFASAPPTNKIKADTKLSLRVQIMSLGVGRPDAAVPDGTSPVNIFVHYGTPGFATGIVFPIDTSAGSQRVGCAWRLSLADEALAFGYPTGTESKGRAIHYAQPTPPRVHDVLPRTEVEWGKATAEGAMTILTDTSFRMTVQMPAGATGAQPYFGVTVNLIIGPQRINGSSQVSLPPVIMGTAGAPTTATVPVVIALPTAGVAVDAGRTLSVSLQLYGSNAPNDLTILYGSTTDPSGFLTSVTGDCAGAAPVAPDDEEPTETVDPDATIGRPDLDQEDTAEDQEPETVVDDEEGAGSAQEATFKDVGVPAAVPGLGPVVVMLGALALVAARRRW